MQADDGGSGSGEASPAPSTARQRRTAATKRRTRSPRPKRAAARAESDGPRPKRAATGAGRSSAQPRRDAVATRERLGEVAIELFLDKGFAATSVREIATASGVTIPALYYHFTSKDGLLAALVEPLSIDGERVLAALADERASHRPVDALAAYYDVVTAHLAIFRLVMVDPAVRSDEVTGRRLAAQGERFLELLTGGSPDRADLIRAHAALGAIRRPLRIDDVDVRADRAQILASARAALDARPD